MKPAVAIVGCGKVGTTLGLYLKRAGYPLAGVASDSLASAQQAAGLLGGTRFSVRASEITKTAEVVFITTPDGIIAAACDGISADDGFCKDAVVLHCSGALPSGILASARQIGAHVGSMHPLQSFAAYPAPLSKESISPFEGIIAAIEGDTPACGLARSIAEDLGAQVYTILTEAKTLYHASAVVASNYLVALMDLAFKLIAAAGIEQPDAFKVLKPLIDGTLANIGKVGIPAALTGPIVRGDAATVRQHVEAIAAQAPALLDLYKQLGRHTITVARAKGDLHEKAAVQLREVLSDTTFGLTQK